MSVQIEPAARHELAEMFRRVPVAFEGRYMLPSREEYLCRTFEMSAAEVSLHALAKPAVGASVVIYLKELGRFEGVAIRHIPIGFEMSLELSERKREKLLEQLVWQERRLLANADDRRKHQRIVPLRKLISVRYPNGEERLATIDSLSCSGIRLVTRYVAMPGSEVVVGRKSASVVRVTEDGFACEFVAPFREDELDENIVV